MRRLWAAVYFADTGIRVRVLWVVLRARSDARRLKRPTVVEETERTMFEETKRIMLCTDDQADERVMHKETGYAEDADDRHGAKLVPVTSETTAVFQWMQDIGAEIEIEIAGCRAPPVFIFSTVRCMRLFLQLFEDKGGLQSFAFLCFLCKYGEHLQWQRTSLPASKAFQALAKKRTTKQSFETLQ